MIAFEDLKLSLVPGKFLTMINSDRGEAPHITGIPCKVIASTRDGVTMMRPSDWGFFNWPTERRYTPTGPDTFRVQVSATIWREYRIGDKP